MGTIIQSLISFRDETYAFPKWHATLLVIAAVCIAFCGNVFGYKVLHLWQNIAFVVHIIAYFAFIIPIWVNAPVATHREVWADFTNYGGWYSPGFAVLVGQLSGIYTQLGLDTAAHMSEEVRDASRSVPRAMMAVYFINFCLVFPAVVTVTYHIGKFLLPSPNLSRDDWSFCFMT